MKPLAPLLLLVLLAASAGCSGDDLGTPYAEGVADSDTRLIAARPEIERSLTQALAGEQSATDEWREALRASFASFAGAFGRHEGLLPPKDVASAHADYVAQLRLYSETVDEISRSLIETNDPDDFRSTLDTAL